MTRTGVAVTLELVFAALAFGARSLVQWRRTGSTGFVLPQRGAPAVERIGAALLVIAILLLIVASASAAANGPRLEVLESDTGAVVGALLAVAGLATCIAAQFTMGESWRIGVDSTAETALVTGGIFAIVRNPIFSAMVLVTAGFALLLANLWAIIALVVLVIGLELQVRFVEEPYLRRVHGVAYRRYAASAGRFLPRMGTRKVAA